MKAPFTLAAVAALLQLQGIYSNSRVMEIIRESTLKLQESGFLRDALEKNTVLNQPQDCVNDQVVVDGEVFPCHDIDFLSFLSLTDLEIEDPPHSDLGISSADIWGWLSPSGREITILAMDNGQAVVDTSDPTNPCILAKLPTRRVVDKWGDNKVYENTLYHVKDTGFRDGPSGTGNYGIEVYDLLQVDQLDCKVPGYVPVNMYPHFVFEGHGRSHNLIINPQSGHLFSVGSEQCNGGLMILDVKTNRLEPKFLACADEDGYTHDAQCLIYDGPDLGFTGREICFAFNEDTLTIWDVTEATAPRVVSLTYYDNQVYSHQGWVNADLTKVLLDDELDEWCNAGAAHPRCDDFETTVLSGERRTTTNVFDITSLTNPVFEGAYVHPEESVDHNLYVWGVVHKKGWGGNPAMKNHPDPNYAYMANYLAGVKVVNIKDEDYSNWFEAGTFDIAPDRTEVEFAGAWSTYMHPSGALAVSSIERGLFMLKPRMAFTDEFPQFGSESEDDDDGASGVLIAFILIAFAALVVVGVWQVRKKMKEGEAGEKEEEEQVSTAPSQKKRPNAKSKFSTQNPMHSQMEEVAVTEEVEVSEKEEAVAEKEV